MNKQNTAAHELGTSAGGRAYLAEYFATQLRRHDFARYIENTLAADFACALAQHLSKLRAPVADERALFETESQRFGYNLARGYRPYGLTDYYADDATERAWRIWKARAALASAPVAGEAQRPHLNIVLDHAADRLAEAGMREDASIVRGMKVPNDGSKTESINAAPQASEAVRVQQLEAARIAYAREFPPDENGDPDVCNIHANIRKLKSQVAALSAQPEQS
jgi:hypothetical protein